MVVVVVAAVLLLLGVVVLVVAVVVGPVNRLCAHAVLFVRGVAVAAAVVEAARALKGDWRKTAE